MLIVFIAVVFFLLHSNITTAYENEIRSLSTTMADNIAKAGKKRIAIVDFTDLQGNITELGRFIAEELSVDLINTAKGFEVIDRNHLNRILAEHKLYISGIVDQKTVQKLGQIAGVDAIVTGSIIPFENSVRVVCKVIATDTARVISAAKGDIAKTKAIEKLLAKGITTTLPMTSLQQDKPKALIKEEVRDFIFEAKECKNLGGIVTCVISITNRLNIERFLDINASDRYCGFILCDGPCVPHTYLYDGMGNEYMASKVEGKECLKKKGFMPNIPVNIKFSFTEVSIPPTKEVTLVVGCYDYQYRHGTGRGPETFKVVFRNIPLSRGERMR